MNPIDQKISEIILSSTQDWRIQFRPIQEWSWKGQPNSDDVVSFPAPKVARPYLSPYGAQNNKDIMDVYVEVDNCIKSASAMECLTSTIPYVRKCKEYFVRNQ